MAGLFGTGLSGIAAAREDESATAEEKGIAEALDSLISVGKVEKARDLANRHGVESTFGEKPLPAFGEQRENDSVGTQDVIDQSGSSLSLFLWKDREEDGDPIFVASAFAYLEPAKTALYDSGAPMDGLGIHWSDTYWQPVSQTADNVTFDGIDTDLIEYEDYYRYGVESRVDDVEIRGDFLTGGGDGKNSYSIGLDTEIEKLDLSNKYNINAEYMHTWNTGGAYYLNSFSLGPVGFSLDGFGVYSGNEAKAHPLQGCG